MRLIKPIFIISCVAIFVFCVYLFVGSARPAENIIWGVNFSQAHARDLGLDWRAVYSAILDDLKVKNIRISADWDMLEPGDGVYDFSDLDFQMDEAEKTGAKVILVFGMKTTRWPECHVPKWAEGLKKEKREEKLLEFIGDFVSRYKSRKNLYAWQLENEPFFKFGNCPAFDRNFFEKEIDTLRRADDTRKPVIITDSGEYSLWLEPAKYGDIVGITMYRKVWADSIKNYFDIPFPPVYYGRKALIIEKIFGKKTACLELQAEPWGETLLYDLPPEKYKDTMDVKKFEAAVSYAKKTGLDTFYLWGAEWWYALKEKQGDDSMWQEAKKVFDQKL